MKKFLLVLLAAIMVFSLISCGRESDEELIVKSDTERLVEGILEVNAYAEKNIRIPEDNYIWSYQDENMKYSIDVNAEIDVYDENIPTIKVNGGGLDQDTVKKLFDYLYPDEKPVKSPEYTPNEVPQMTKDEILQMIDFYETAIKEGTLEEKTVMSEEEAFEYIAELEEKLKTAPDKLSVEVPEVADGTMDPKHVEIYDDEGNLLFKYDDLHFAAETDDSMIAATTKVSGIGGNGALFHYSKDSEMGNYRRIAEITEDGSGIPENAKEKITISIDDAKNLCDEFFAAGDIKDISLAGIYIVSDEADDNIPGDNKHFGYELIYVRTVNGIPTALISDNVGGGGDIRTVAQWRYEYIEIKIENTRITNIFWESPTTTGETITESTDLLSFDEITDVFETMIVAEAESQTKYHYVRSDADDFYFNIDIDEIQLRPLRIRNDDETREGIYTPAWIFYGTTVTNIEYQGNEYTDYNSMIYQDPIKYPVLAINAVDGSIVDIQK